ncbi:N-acetyltransferase [Bacillus toyonensis]|nr:N-acetyltransferase [Bacillus toyonensis]
MEEIIMEENFLKYDYFKNINLMDPFFDSLKHDYKEFEDWFKRKSEEKAYYYETDNGIQAFLYLKVENEALEDVSPILPKKERIKIGTLKINPHGTKLGERFLKKAIDFAITNNIFELYVTVFSKHDTLVDLLKRYGFEIIGQKETRNGIENVMIKNLEQVTGDSKKDYPLVNLVNKSIYLLGIKPEFHTLLFPDSILNNESYKLISDVSHTNSIEKVYICYMRQAAKLKKGDTIVIYRMKDDKGSAEFRSVATSICVVEEVKLKSDFESYEEYWRYCKKHSVFNDEELKSLYRKDNLVVIKMTYNLAMEKRLIRRTLADQCGLDRNQRWGIMKLKENQFRKIVELGGINESFIID